MKTNTPRSGLIALNFLLLAVLIAVSFVPQTDAQTSRSQRYIGVPGRVNGLTPSVVYIMDTTQQEFVAVTWDHNNNRVVTIGYRPFASDVAAAIRN
jgi:hypothetical protein